MKNKMDRIPVLMRNRKNLNNGSKYCKKQNISEKEQKGSTEQSWKQVIINQIHFCSYSDP